MTVCVPRVLRLFLCVLLLGTGRLLAGPAGAAGDPPLVAPVAPLTSPRPQAQLGSIPLSRSELATLHAFQPHFARLRSMVALHGQGHTDDALSALKRFIRESPEFGTGIAYFLFVSQESGRLEEAVQFFETRAREVPRDPLAWYGLGESLNRLKRWQAGLEAGKQAIALGCREQRCYSSVASAFRKLDQVEAGTRFFEALARSQSDALAGFAWLGLGALLMDDATQREAADQALERAERLLEPGRGQEGALAVRSMFLHNAGRLEDAVDLYRRLIAQFEAMGDLSNVARILDNLAMVCQQLEWREAEADSLERSVALFRSQGERRREAEALVRLAALRRVRGELVGAQALLEPLRAWPEVQQDVALQLRVQLEYASLISLLGRYEEAKALYTELLETSRRHHLSALECSVLLNLGRCHHEAGDIGKAISFYEQALAGYRALPDRAGEGLTLQNLGDFLLRIGEQERGRGMLEQALQIHLEVGSRTHQSITLSNLGDVELASGDPAGAVRRFEQALELQRALRDRRLEAAMIERLAQARLALGDFDQALALGGQALELSRATGSRLEEAGALALLGQTERARGRVPEAIVRLQEARLLYQALNARRYEAETLSALARAHADQGERGRAWECLEAGLAARRSLTRSAEDPYLESAYFTSGAVDYPLAVRLRVSDLPGNVAPPMTPETLSETFGLAEEARSQSFLRWLQLARHELTTGAPEALLQKFQQAREGVNHARRLLSGPESAPEVTRVLEAQLEAWLQPHLERQRHTGGTLPEEARGLETAKAGLTAGSLAPRERIVWLERLLSEREQVWREAERALYDGSPAARALVTPELATLKTVRSRLDDHTVLVAYLLGEAGSYAWIVTRQGVRLVQLPPEAAIASRVDALLANLRDRQSLVPVLAADAHALYRMLLEPMVQEIAAGKRLVVVPDGALARLPFEALVTEPPRPGRPAAWLALKTAVSYAPSATSWRLDDQPLPEGRLLAVGDPVYQEDGCEQNQDLVATRASSGADLAGTRAGLLGERWNRLCFSGEELHRIARSRKSRGRGAADLVLSGLEATEARLRAQSLSSFSLLHFATHGVVYPDAPLRSALLLGQNLEGAPAGRASGPGIGAESTGGAADGAAQGEPAGGAGRGVMDDGYLDLREVLHLDLRASLVVLSACETAAGRARRGEGIESLARGFLLAGAERVVASQWQVDDAATARFMGGLYRELKRHPVDEALWRVRRDFLLERATSHPYYWAPFVLVGGGAIRD